MRRVDYRWFNHSISFHSRVLGFSALSWNNDTSFSNNLDEGTSSPGWAPKQFPFNQVWEWYWIENPKNNYEESGTSGLSNTSNSEVE